MPKHRIDDGDHEEGGRKKKVKKRKKLYRSRSTHPDGLPTGKKGILAPWPRGVYRAGGATMYLPWEEWKQAPADQTAQVVALDEAGRGSYAGPLVCAAVSGVDGSIDVHDSKLRTPSERNETFEKLIKSPWLAYSLAFCPNEVIDKKGMGQAWRDCMGTAAKTLIDRKMHQRAKGVGGDFHVIVDGNVSNVTLPRQAPAWEDRAAPAPTTTFSSLVKADRSIWQAAAAGILAKVARDRHMDTISTMVDPEWAPIFKEGKGYRWKPCHDHLVKQGKHTPYHRTSFNPLRSALKK